MPDTTSPVEYQQGNFLSMQHQAMENYTGVPTKTFADCFLYASLLSLTVRFLLPEVKETKTWNLCIIIIKIIRGHSRFPIRNCKGRLQVVSLRILKRSYI